MRLEIKTSEEERLLGRPRGRYITLEFPDISFEDPENLREIIRDDLEYLLPERDGLILAAGLGNTEITPDALGPAVARGIFATRHIPQRRRGLIYCGRYLS